jgi:hypothetical protein
MTAKKSKSELENVTPAMLDAIVTKEVTEAVDAAVIPAVRKFQDAHPLIAVGYDFTVTLNDGLRILKGGSQLPHKKQASAIRKYREALLLSITHWQHTVTRERFSAVWNT